MAVGNTEISHFNVAIDENSIGWLILQLTRTRNCLREVATFLKKPARYILKDDRDSKNDGKGWVAEYGADIFHTKNLFVIRQHGAQKSLQYAWEMRPYSSFFVIVL